MKFSVAIVIALLPCLSFAQEALAKMETLFLPELIVDNQVESVLIEGSFDSSKGGYQSRKFEFDKAGKIAHEYYTLNNGQDGTVGYYYDKGKIVQKVFASEKGRELRSISFFYKEEKLLKIETKTLFDTNVESINYFLENGTLTTRSQKKNLLGIEVIETKKYNHQHQVDSIFIEEGEAATLKIFEYHTDSLIVHSYSKEKNRRIKSTKTIFNKNKLPLNHTTYYYEKKDQTIAQIIQTIHHYHKNGLIERVQYFIEKSKEKEGNPIQETEILFQYKYRH